MDLKSKEAKEGWMKATKYFKDKTKDDKEEEKKKARKKAIQAKSSKDDKISSIAEGVMRWAKNS